MGLWSSQRTIRICDRTLLIPRGLGNRRDTDARRHANIRVNSERQRTTVPTANTSTYFVEFGRQVKEPRSQLRCSLEHTGIYIFFEGSPRYVPDWFEIHKQMSADTPQKWANFGNV